jgi:hypothetical protein
MSEDVKRAFAHLLDEHLRVTLPTETGDFVRDLVASRMGGGE